MFNLTQQSQMNRMSETNKTMTAFDNELILSQDKINFVNEEKEKTNRLNKQFQDEKNKIFRLWIFLGIAANIAQIVSSIFCLFARGFEIGTADLSVGISCLLTCINVCSYIEYSHKYSIVYRTIMTVLPNVARYLIGVLPIFFGFVLFGKTYLTF